MKLLIALALTFPVAVQAHDVWMQPDRFVVPAETAVPYRVYVGHGAARELWNVGASRVLELRIFGPRGSAIVRPAVAESGVLKFDSVGTYVTAMVSSNSVSDLPALRFNDYAQVEGLTPILEARARLGQAQRNGRELYSRRTKMLVKVGRDRGPQQHILRPLGLTLEITPQVDPFLTAADRPLPVVVTYFGKPLPGATVKLTNLDADAAPIASARTDSEGTTTFRHPGKGRWQLNVVWSRELTNNPDAEFETVFSSLTFGS